MISRSGVVVLLVVSSVRTVRVREWTRAPGFLFDARLPDFLSWRCSGYHRGHSTYELCQGSVGGVDNRPESRRLYDHPRAHGGRGGGLQDTGGSFRSTGGAPRRTPATFRRRPPDDETYGAREKVITRTEAVVTLRMMAASAGKNPAHIALHSGRIGGATKLAAQEMSELQIQRAGR